MWTSPALTAAGRFCCIKMIKIGSTLIHYNLIEAQFYCQKILTQTTYKQGKYFLLDLYNVWLMENPWEFRFDWLSESLEHPSA